MKYIYPDGKPKALTFSYDDGEHYDRRLVGIFNEYGLKGTFHLNSGNLGKQMEILEQDGFLSCRKELLGRRPRSTYSLTETGRETFLAYVRMLEKIAGESHGT